MADNKTNKKESESTIAELNSRILELEATIKAQTGFLAVMGHEIRTPMNAIIGSSRLLKDALNHEEQLQYTGIIEAAGNLLLGIVDNVLNYSRIETGTLSLLENRFYLNDVVEVIRAIMSEIAESKKLQFDVQSDVDSSVELLGDDIKLQQVILNLCINAVKYTNTGRVVFRIEKLSESKTVNRYKFSIIDSGIGISKEDVKGLFKPFFRVNAGANKRVDGTGLGLSIAKNLVDLMGGNIGVESKMNKGSTFWVELEFKRGLKVERRTSSPKQRKHYAVIKNNLNILIVDDYSFSRIILEKVLMKSGCTSIDVATNGKEAVSLFLTKKYDVIFMDCIMPVMNGFEATVAIRKLEKANQHTCIIALSGDVLKENRETCQEAGMDYFLEKPVNPKKTDDMLRNIILKKIL